jgi:hypothetical protein
MAIEVKRRVYELFQQQGGQTGLQLLLYGLFKSSLRLDFATPQAIFKRISILVLNGGFVGHYKSQMPFASSIPIISFIAKCVSIIYANWTGVGVVRNLSRCDVFCLTELQGSLTILMVQYCRRRLRIASSLLTSVAIQRYR